MSHTAPFTPVSFIQTITKLLTDVSIRTDVSIQTLIAGESLADLHKCKAAAKGMLEAIKAFEFPVRSNPIRAVDRIFDWVEDQIYFTNVSESSEKLYFGAVLSYIDGVSRGITYGMIHPRSETAEDMVWSSHNMQVSPGKVIVAESETDSSSSECDTESVSSDDDVYTTELVDVDHWDEATSSESESETDLSDIESESDGNLSTDSENDSSDSEAESYLDDYSDSGYSSDGSEKELEPLLSINGYDARCTQCGVSNGQLNTDAVVTQCTSCEYPADGHDDLYEPDGYEAVCEGCDERIGYTDYPVLISCCDKCPDKSPDMPTSTEPEDGEVTAVLLTEDTPESDKVVVEGDGSHRCMTREEYAEYLADPVPEVREPDSTSATNDGWEIPTSPSEWKGWDLHGVAQ